MDDRRLLMAITLTLALAVVTFAFGLFIDLLPGVDLMPSHAGTVTGK